MALSRNARLLACTTLPLLLSACSDPVSDVTDDQLLTLLGDSREAYGVQLPPRITTGMEECVRLVSGLEDEVVKDIPDEFLGQMKAECRTEFRERLEKPDLNPMGLTLENFDERELGERVSALAEPSREAAKQAAEEARTNKQQAELDAARASIAEVQASLDDRLASLDALCGEWTAAHDMATAQGGDIPSALRWYNPMICSDGYADRVRERADEVAARLDEMVPDAGPFGMMIPPFGEADPERMEEKRQELESKLKELTGLAPGVLTHTTSP